MTIGINAQKELKKFMSEANRLKEQSFAKLFTEKKNISVAFEIGNGAHTNGQKIVVDPTTREIFADSSLLDEVTAFLKWPEDLRIKIKKDYWLALKFVTRAQTLHECLHILYTDFPPHSCKDPVCDNDKKRKVMHYIENIIEDAYIENVGCLEYDNLSLYIDFGRVSEGLAACKNPEYYEGFQEASPIEQYIAEMITRILYPFTSSRGYSKDVASYILKTEPLFKKGIVAASPDERYRYCQQIFQELLPIIEEGADDLNESLFDGLMSDPKTHIGKSDDFEESFGQSQSTNARHPLSDEEGKPKKDTDLDDEKTENDENNMQKNAGSQCEKPVDEEEEQPDNTDFKTEQFKGIDEKKSVTYPQGVADDELEYDSQISTKLAGALENQLRKIFEDYVKEEEELNNGNKWNENNIVLSGEEISGKVVHKGININLNYPDASEKDKNLYDNAYKVYKLNIEKYRRMFKQILKVYVEEREDRRFFGSGIDARKFGDIKKRYWYRKLQVEDVPDLAVMLLIDGSGSMSGARSRAAMQSAIIMHEVLSAHNIPHAVIEHRTSKRKSIDINILFDFEAKEKQKYAIAKINGSGGNRDGLALYWVGNYLDNKLSNENKLVIVLSDGAPSDYNSYSIGIKDTADAAQLLKKRGVEVIAIALEDKGGTSTYEALQHIYKNVILCDDLYSLTRQVLETISRILMNR